MGLGHFACAAALLGLFSLSAGCSHFASPPSVQLRSLSLEMAPKANDDAALAVDFVAVQDPELLELLSSIPARQWFERREQMRRDYPNAIEVWSLELVPGQFAELRDIPLAGNPAVGLLVYASYSNPGTHRLRLDRQKTVWLRFENTNMRLLGDASQD